MENAFDRPISKLTTEEISSELEGQQNLPKLKHKEKKEWKKPQNNRASVLWNSIKQFEEIMPNIFF